MNQVKDNSRRKALVIGIVFCFSYLVSYVLRKILGLVRTEMIAEAIFSGMQLDSFQSVFMICYALGQLINGIIGDFLPPRRMITLAFLSSGIAVLIFAFSDIYLLSFLSFALFGYGISMFRGPMLKLVSENTKPQYARLICTVFNAITYFATLIAAMLVQIFHWKNAFLVSSILALIAALCLWIFISRKEKCGDFKSVQAVGERPKLSFGEIWKIFKLPNFPFFILAAGLTEIVGTTVAYWIPSFIEGYLGQSSSFANYVASAISFGTAVCAFVALLLFRICKEKTKGLFCTLFGLSGAAFLLLLFVKNLWVDLICLSVGMLLIGCISSLIWSIYIPGLGKTGKVSGANGVMDCSGYLFAGLSNVLFSFLAGNADNPNWNRLILAWFGVAFIGALLTFLNREGKSEEKEGVKKLS